MKNYLRFSLKNEGAFLTVLTYAVPGIGLLVFLVLWILGYLKQ